ncbi:MAG: RlmE family RNA methyltransferase [bacterium]|nr:RlmE family RNA methyltransferase [bacterium]
MSRSSKRWLSEHRKDRYVRQAREEKFRARSAYKLQQIQQKFHLLHPGDRVVDLGAAPGGWSQVAAGVVGRQGAVVAVDLLAMAPIPGVTVLQGDIFEERCVEAILAELPGRSAQVILSDMAPSTTGIASVDHDRSAALAEAVLDLVPPILAPGGRAALKIFQGRGVPAIQQTMGRLFGSCRVFKPPASRSRSVEIYLVGLGYGP